MTMIRHSTKEWVYHIEGRAATKKTGQRIIRHKGRPILIQSKAWLAYEKIALRVLKEQKALIQAECITGPVWVVARHWLPNYAHWPDLTGLWQGVGDLLEEAGIITNDKHIVSWNDSCIMGVDPNRPVAEITVIPLEEVALWQRQPKK